MRSVAKLHSVAAARALARRVLPRVVFDYVDGGAEDEVTMEENIRAFREVALAPKMGVTVSEPDLRTSVVGTPIAVPVLLAPCGLVRLMHPDGAVGVARAALDSGTISVLSTVAGSPAEELADLDGPRWFQLYASGRDIASALMDSAAGAGFDGLVVTLDTPTLGKRERDIVNGVPTPLRLDAGSAIRLGSQVMARPGWAWRMGRAGIRFRRRAQAQSSVSGAMLSPAVKVVMEASPFSWSDVEWIRSRWKGPLLVKGVLSGHDVLAAAGAGADAVIVSNHGGRQLEGAPATLRVLPEVAEAAGNRIEVLLDGGVRRGGDVVKALALGARAVLVGRAYLYGLAAGGQGGVARVLEILREEMVRTLVLMGCASVAELGPEWVRPAGPTRDRGRPD